jgi:hypothetical protein
MLNPIVGSRFKRDVKRMEKRGKEMAKLREAIQLPIEGNPLPPHVSCSDGNTRGPVWLKLRFFHPGQSPNSESANLPQRPVGV